MIFSACASDSEPPNTVKSLAKTKTVRPLTVPQPVTTPSPGIFVFSMPKSVERCSTNMSNSSNEPSSSRSSMRSRAVSLPRRVLGRDARLAAAEPRLRAPLFEPFEHVFHGRSEPAAGGEIDPTRLSTAVGGEPQNPTMYVRWNSIALRPPAQDRHNRITL